MTRRQFIRRVNRVVFVVALIVLVGYLIFPYTKFYYFRPFFTPFSMRLNKFELVLEVGDTYKLKVMSLNVRVKYYSIDIKVADVLFNGKVIAFRPGKTVIIAKVGDKRVKCYVTVIKLSTKEATLRIGDKKNLDVQGPHGNITWTTDDPNIAVVDNDGIVEAIAEGTTTITAKVSGKKLTCKLIVDP